MKIMPITISENHNLDTNARLKLYPNPSQEYIQLEGMKDLKARYLIVNNSGQLIETGSVTSSDSRINLEAILPGTYNLIVIENEERSRLQFVKM